MTKSPGAWKHFVAAFAITLIGYVVVFNWIEHRRVKNGPWEVTFQNVSGQLELVVNQNSEAVHNVRIQFIKVPLETNLSQTIQFTAGRKVPFDVPFGKCVFLDPLFLPGKIVLEIASHEVQIMPRVLILDGAEHVWSSEKVFVLGEAKRNETPK